MPVPLHIHFRHVWTNHLGDPTNPTDLGDETRATRQALGQWIFSVMLFHWSHMQRECVALAREGGLLDRAHNLKKALRKKGSAGNQKVEFDECLSKAQAKTRSRVKQVLRQVPQANLDVGWLHGLMVVQFNTWIAGEAGLQVHSRLTRKQVRGPKIRGRQRIDRQAILNRCECYLTLAFGESTQMGVRAGWPDAKEVILVSLYDFSNPAKGFAAEHNIRLFSIAKDYLKTDYRPSR